MRYIRAFAAELLGRYYHLSSFIDQRSRDAGNRSHYLFSAYRSELKNAIAELELFTPNIFALPDNFDPNTILDNAFDELAEHSIRFQRNHRALRSFGTPWPESEVFEFLRRLFEENGLSRRFQDLHPTIVYSSEFNFLKYDLRQDLALPKAAATFAVWALPMAEATNPLLWPVLVHEVAHSLFNPEIIQKRLHHEFRSTYTSEVLATVKRWSIELNADYFGYRLLGPAYIFCLMYFGMFFITDRLREPLNEDAAFSIRTHPAPEERLKYLHGEFNDFLHAHSLDKNSEWVGVYKAFCGMYDARMSIDRSRKNHENAQAVIVDLNPVWPIIKDIQHELLPELKKVGFCPAELASASRLSKMLRNGRVGGAVRDRDDLSELQMLLAGTSKASKQRVVRCLNDRPARMFEVLNAGWTAKIRAMSEWRLPSSQNRSDDPAIMAMIERVRKHARELTKLLQKSTQISIILSSVSPTLPHTCKD